MREPGKDESRRADLRMQAREMLTKFESCE